MNARANVQQNATQMHSNAPVFPFCNQGFQRCKFEGRTTSVNIWKICVLRYLNICKFLNLNIWRFFKFKYSTIRECKYSKVREFDYYWTRLTIRMFEYCNVFKYLKMYIRTCLGIWKSKYLNDWKLSKSEFFYIWKLPFKVFRVFALSHFYSFNLHS